MDAALVPHLRRADRIVVDRFRDAAAHARQGDVVTAAQRLADLHHSLIGPDGTGAIGDARVAFYRDAWRHDPHDPEIHDPNLMHPAWDGAQAARTAPIGGIDARRDLGLLLERARHGLATVVGNSAAIDTWHQQHATAVRGWARRTLSDSQISINAATGYLRLKPEYRD